MDIAVTGAYGHLGVNLIDLLTGLGHSVRAVDVRRTASLDAYDVQHVHADMTDRDAARAAFDGADVVYHLAARISVIGDPDGSVWKTNVDGATTAARAAAEVGVGRFVFTSSVHALRIGEAAGTVDEAAPATTSSRAPVYDRSKATAERFIADIVEDGLDAVIIRPTGIIGPGDHDVSRMGAFLRAIGEGRIPAVTTGGFDWVDVRDVASGMVAAAERGTRGAAYLLGGHFATMRELADLASEIAGARPPRFTIPLAVASVFGRPATLIARRTGNPMAPTSEALDALRSGRPVDHSLARADLGYEPRPLEETLRDFYVWWDEAGSRS